MADDEALSEKKGISAFVKKLQGFAPQPDPFPEIFFEIPTVKKSDRFVFIFRMLSQTRKERKTTASKKSLFDQAKKFLSPRAGGPKFEQVVFVLPKNPSKESRQQTKNIQFNLTDGGYVILNWGNGPINLTFTGTTGRLVPEDEIPEQDRVAFQKAEQYPNRVIQWLTQSKNNETLFRFPTNVRQTMAWRVFSKFNYFYQYFNGGNEYAWDPSVPMMDTPRSAQVILSFFDRVFVGALTEFGYDVDANDPWQIHYSFKFVSLPIQESIGRRTPIGPTKQNPLGALNTDFPLSPEQF